MGDRAASSEAAQGFLLTVRLASPHGRQTAWADRHDAGYEHVAEPLVRLCSRAVRRAEGIEQASELALASSCRFK